MKKKVSRKKFFIKVTKTVVSRIFQKILNFVSFLYIVNNMPPDVVGNFQFVISLVMTTSIFSLSGMNMSLMTTLSRKKNGFFLMATNFTFRYSFLGSIILLIISIYSFIIGNNAMAISFAFTSVLNPFFKGLLTWKVSQISSGRHLELTKVELLNSITLNLLLIFSVSQYIGSHIYLVLISVLIPSVQNFILFFREKNLHTKKNKNKFKKEIKYGFQYSLQDIFPLIAKEIDKITIYFFLSPASLAFFHVLSKVPDFIKNFNQEVIYLILPKFAKQHFFSNRLNKITNLYNLFNSFFIVLFAFSIYPYIYKIFFISQYQEFLFMSQVLMCSIALTSDVFVKGAFISTQLNIISYRKYTIYNALIKIMLSPILIYYFDIWGAIFAILFQRLFTKIYINYLLKIYHKKK
jgi:O-antigen/teichoic acid export membrane protein